jgi:hypothetical protein
MDFAIISPTSGLERYATLSKVHLVLSHQCGDPVYRDFYLGRREAGDTLILDNGAYENGEPFINPETVQYLEPSVVVLPDYPLQKWQKTWHAAIHTLDVWDHEALEFQWLYIPQAEKGDLHGFLESYTEAADDPRISWIGIPRALAYAITDNPLMRVEFARMVRKDHPRLKLHAFGMVNGDVHEIPYLDAAGVTSIDSSAPVWRGWNGFSIHDPKWDGKAVDFSSTAPDEQLDHLIKHNLEACGVRIQHRP